MTSLRFFAVLIAITVASPAVAELTRITANDDSSDLKPRTVNATSHDGRYVLAFDPDGHPIDPNGWVYLWLDTKTGNHKFASSDSNGDPVATLAADMSSNGRYVLFRASLQKVDAYTGPSASKSGAGLFLKDMHTGETRLVSLNQDGSVADVTIPDIALSGLGDYAFIVTPTALTAADQNSSDDVYRWNLSSYKKDLVSKGLSGNAANGKVRGVESCFSGEWVVFKSKATNLTSDSVDGQGWHAFVSNVSADEITLASKNASDVPADKQASHVAFSGDCDSVVFESSATNLHAEDQDTYVDVFRYRVSDNSINLVSTDSYGAAIGDGVRMVKPQQVASFDGQKILIASHHHRSIEDYDAFVKDMESGDLVEASIEVGSNASPNVEDLANRNARISADGEVVTFSSLDKLLDEDSNTNKDLYQYTPDVCP